MSPGEVTPRALDGWAEERLRHRAVRLRVAVGLAQVAAGENEAHELWRGYVLRYAQVNKGHVFPTSHLFVVGIGARGRGGGQVQFEY